MFNTDLYMQQKLNQLNAIGYNAGPMPQDANELMNIFSGAGMTPEQHYYKYGVNEGLNPWASGGSTNTTNTTNTANTSNQQQGALTLGDLNSWWSQQQATLNNSNNPNSLSQLFPRTNWGNYQTSQRGGRYFDSTSGKYQGLGNIAQTQTASL